RPMLAFAGDLHRSRLRPGSALLDPGAEQPDLFGSQSFPFPGHDFVRHAPGHELDQKTLRAFPGNDGRTEIPALQSDVLCVETIGGFLALRPMTTEAVLGENRLDIP